MLTLAAEESLLLRLRSQRLWRENQNLSELVAQVVARACGLQAQEKPSAMLGVRARTRELSAAAIENALYRERTIIHTWCMRGTLHFVAAEDLAWMLPLLGPVFIKAGARRNLELGLDDLALKRGAQVIRDELARRGPLTRHELKPALQAAGLPTEGQATIHLIAHAALKGLVCVEPERDSKPTYALLAKWGGLLQPMDRGEALAELARRYLDAFAPTGLADFASWSGLSMQDARQGWEGMASEAVHVDVAGKPAWMPREHLAWLEEQAPSVPLVCLLPRYDNYLLGYASRVLAVAPEHEKQIHPGGGIIHAVILVDGRAAGTWQLKRQPGGLKLTIEPFEQFSSSVIDGIKAEIAAMSRFLGEDIVYG
jgi:hypothetical protein